MFTLVLCSNATLTSFIDPSVRIVTKSPKVGPLLLSVLRYGLVTFSSEALVVPPPSSPAACPQRRPETGPAEREER